MSEKSHPSQETPDGDKKSTATMKIVIDTVKSEFQLQHFGLGCAHPRRFVACQWQQYSDASVWYMLYRWIVTLYFMGTFLYNILHSIFREEMKPNRTAAKWYFYMTYWGYLLCTLQAFIGAILVTRSWSERDAEDERKARGEMTLILKVYWVLHTTALDMAISITSIFWVVIYNPAVHNLDFITMDNHVFNSAVMALDFFLVGHPTRLFHVHWPLEFLMSYFVFSVIYFWMGGVQIYPVLNWNKPFITTVICGSALLYLVFVHLVTWILHLMRRRVAESLHTRQSHIPDEVKIAFVNSQV